MVLIVVTWILTTFSMEHKCQYWRNTLLPHLPWRKRHCVPPQLWWHSYTIMQCHNPENHNWTITAIKSSNLLKKICYCNLNYFRIAGAMGIKHIRWNFPKESGEQTLVMASKKTALHNLWTCNSVYLILKLNAQFLIFFFNFHSEESNKIIILCYVSHTTGHTMIPQSHKG